MNKQKTKKNLMKRFTVTTTGKVMRGRQNARHLRSNKSRNQRNRSRETTLAEVFAKRYKQLMG